jgi:16S rRNA C967 or C1407 C5-methylase (RsmB/RsmF family)/NOL1/NOP2/fmu family ribosome biogenesis protein
LFPQVFIEQMRQLLGDSEWQLLAVALDEPPPVSIRYNPNRRPADPTLLPAAAGPVLWHPEGVYLKERPVFTLDPLFHAGAYYVQEASSMFVYEVLRQTGRLCQPLKILDLCAAPGGKTTLLNDALEVAKGGFLAANEVMPTRAAVLRENLERWGVAYAAVLGADVDKFESLTDWFDVILVDAPCSGEGMFRKDPDAVGEWSPGNVALCTTRQSHILEAAEKILAPGGLLLYSTCTYNRSENEDNFKRHIDTLGYNPVVLDIPEKWGVTSSDCGYKFFPHRTKGEGFFIAAYEKKGDSATAKMSIPGGFKHLTPLPKKQISILASWINPAQGQTFWTTPSGEILAIPEKILENMRILDPLFKNKWFGCPIGTIKGTDFIPGHALALSDLLLPVPRLDLTREQALTFLKKETFPPPPESSLGWTLVTYSDLPLGWIKILPNRINNYLPPERRIRMEVKGR